jgi:hypothetical protein
VRGRPHILVASACIPLLGCNPSPDANEASATKQDLRRCKPSTGTTGSPSTIEEAVQLANALPFPVTAECFVEALDRPLRLEATRSRSSAQPAAGERSPRLFLWTSETFVITIAIDGRGRNLVEFGQFVTPRRSIKGELEFPLTGPVSITEPLDRIRNAEFPRITTCFVCHDHEEDEPSVPRGRSSLALRPHPATLVSVDALHGELERCDESAEPERCRWLHALLDHGPIEHRPFDAALPVF